MRQITPQEQAAADRNAAEREVAAKRGEQSSLTRRSHVLEMGTLIDRGDKRTFEMKTETRRTT